MKKTSPKGPVRIVFQQSEEQEAPDGSLTIGTGTSVRGLKAIEGLVGHLSEMQGVDSDVIVRQLEDEFDRLKAQLRAMTESHKAASEEMGAANEKMRSFNKALRWTAEELEASKEELQAANEALLALNEELKSKIDEINRVNSGLQNLMNATEIGTIFLDRQLCIKRYTPRAEELFEITEADVGRPLIHLTHRLVTDMLHADMEQVLHEGVAIERELQHSVTLQWFLVRLQLYHTVEGTIEGVVIVFVDITRQKKHDEQLEGLNEKLEEMIAERVEQVRQLASELVKAEQAERQRIAQILHDDLQQMLVALQIRVSALSGSLSQKETERLAQINTLIAQALKVTRTLTVELSPPVLKSEQIAISLEWLAIQMKEMHGLNVVVETSDQVRAPADIRLLVFQLARELLFNVVKHAGIDRARLHLVHRDGWLILAVEDKGLGFDMAAGQGLQPAKQGGFGLHSIRQRLHLFGGRFVLKAAPGQGTRATVFVPFERVGRGAEGTRTADQYETLESAR